MLLLTPTASGPAHELAGVLVPHELLEALPPRQLLRLLGELELRGDAGLHGARVVGHRRVVALLLVGGSATHLARSNHRKRITNHESLTRRTGGWLVVG